MNWLRVFGDAEASRMGSGVGQHVTRERCGQKHGGTPWQCGGRECGVIATFFGLYAPDPLTAHSSVFSQDFKGFERSTKLATSSLKPHVHAITLAAR